MTIFLRLLVPSAYYSITAWKLVFTGLTGWHWIALCLLLTGCSVLSKEQGLTVMAVCIVYDYFCIQKVGCVFGEMNSPSHTLPLSPSPSFSPSPSLSLSLSLSPSLSLSLPFPLSASPSFSPLLPLSPSVFLSLLPSLSPFRWI